MKKTDRIIKDAFLKNKVREIYCYKTNKASELEIDEPTMVEKLFTFLDKKSPLAQFVFWFLVSYFVGSALVVLLDWWHFS